MNIKVRQYRARLCEKYVEKLSPSDFAAIQKLAEDAYKDGKPQFTLGFTFTQFWREKSARDFPI